MQDNAARDNEGRLTALDTPGHWRLEMRPRLAGQRVPVRLGAQSWGTLNAARDNAILVCHYYTGTMRAAGLNPDGTPAWWDSVIGPGKALDTSRFFVICLNSYSNAQSQDPDIITTGSDTPDAAGKVWGERFPRWDFADLHAAQLELMRQLGLPRWHAVVGPSFGGMQALQWAARSPELAGRVAALVTSPWAGPVIRDAFGPMLRDIAPVGGLEGALRLISFFGLGADGLEKQFRSASFGTYLRTRMTTCSLPHILDIGRVVATHDLYAIAPQQELFGRWINTNLRLLTINMTVDQFFPAAEMRAFAGASQQAGVAHQHLEIDSPYGHLGCLQDTAKFAPALADFLNQPATAPETKAPEPTHV